MDSMTKRWARFMREAMGTVVRLLSGLIPVGAQFWPATCLCQGKRTAAPAWVGPHDGRR